MIQSHLNLTLDPFQIISGNAITTLFSVYLGFKQVERAEKKFHLSRFFFLRNLWTSLINSNPSVQMYRPKVKKLYYSGSLLIRFSWEDKSKWKRKFEKTFRNIYFLLLHTFWKGKKCGQIIYGWYQTQWETLS